MRKRNKRLYQIAATVFLLVCLLISLNEMAQKPFLPTWDSIFAGAKLDDTTPLPAGELTIQMIDVGNADAFLISSKDTHMLIDAGERGDGEAVLQTLRERNITTLDWVIATHADADHIGGMQEVVEAVTVNRYMMSFMPKGHTPTTKTYYNLLAAIDKLDIALVEATMGYTFPLGDATVEILGPVKDFEDNNNQSVICCITYGKKRFLFMGDAETAAETALLQSGVDLSADLLKVGHHGSDTSTTAALLKQVRPTIALIPCGEGNKYGHPGRYTLMRLNEMDAAVYRADLHGDVTVRCDGESIHVTTEKGEKN